MTVELRILLLIALFAAGFIARRIGWLKPPHAGRMLQLVPVDRIATENSLERLSAMVDRRIGAARRALGDGEHALARMLLQPVLQATTDTDSWAARLHRAVREIMGGIGDDDARQAHENWLLAHHEPLDPRADGAPPDEPGQTFEGVLADHLRRAVTLCHRRGVLPILATYPYDWTLQTVHARVTGEQSAELADTWPVLRKLLTADPSSIWFVPDGHCNDAGYGQLAKVVAAAIDRALRR